MVATNSPTNGSAAPKPISSQSGASPAAGESNRLQSRAVAGSAITIAAVGAGQILRLISNVVVTHLLFPEAYGVMAIVGAILFGLQLLSDLGTRVSIIQNPKGDDPEFLDTAWTIEIVRGLSIFVLGCALAYPMARVYQNDVLMYLIPVAAFASLIGGFTSTKLIRQLRHIQLGRNVAIDLSSQVLGLIAMAGHALIFRSVWSLVMAPVVSAAARAIMSHVLVEGAPNRFRWHRESAKAILHTGKWIFIGTTILFAAQKNDVFILPKLTSLDRVGLYSIALNLALLPMNFAGPVVNQVLLPALSASFRDSHDALVAAFARARRVIMPAGILAIVGTAVFAPPFFMIAYDTRYHAAGWITVLYMLLTWFHFLTEALGRALQAMDDARTLAFGHVARLVVGTAGMLYGWHTHGLPGFLVGNALGALASFIVVERKLRQHGLADIGADVRYTILGVAMVASCAWLTATTLNATGLGFPLVSVTIGLIVFGTYAVWAGLKMISDVREVKAMRAGPAVP